MPPSEDETQARLEAGDRKMSDLQEQIDGLRSAIADNTALTQQIRDSTAGLVEAFGALRGGLKVLEAIGRAARPVSYIVAAVAAGLGLWQTLKGLK